MASRSLWSKLVGASALLSLLVGCAHRATDEPRSWDGGEVDPKLSELEAQLQSGEDRLSLALGPPPSTPPGLVTEQQSAPPPPPEPPAGAAPAPAPAAGPPAGPDAAPASDFDDQAFSGQPAAAPPARRQTPVRSACDEGCDAFQSMERAAKRICRLAGAADARCSRARDRVAVARERLRAAGCGCE